MSRRWRLWMITPLMSVMALTGLALAEPPLAGPPLAPSLEGTRPDCDGLVRARDHVVANLELRRCIDYFLSARGEVPERRLRAAFVHTVTEALGEDLHLDAGAFFDRYLGYLGAIPAPRWRRAPVPLGDLLAEQRRVESMQTRWLGKQARGLFGADNARRRQVIAAGAMAGGQVTSGWPLLSGTPAEALLPLTLRAGAQALIKQGADGWTLHRWHRQQVGTAAAWRLRALDGRRARFQRRYQAWRRARGEALARLKDPAAQAQLEAKLRARWFSGPTLRRVTALDRLNQKKELP